MWRGQWCIGACTHESRSSAMIDSDDRNGIISARFFTATSPTCALKVRRLHISKVTSSDVAMIEAERGLPVSKESSPHQEPALS